MVAVHLTEHSTWHRLRVWMDGQIGRLEWYLLYLQAGRHMKECRLLEQAILSLFRKRVQERKMWITSIFYRSAGRFGQEEGHISWLAPLDITLWLDNAPALCMGIDFGENRIRVRQLAVAEKFSVPESLQGWPLMFLSACAVVSHECGMPLRLMRQPALIDPFFKNHDELWIDLFLPRHGSS